MRTTMLATAATFALIVAAAPTSPPAGAQTGAEIGALTEFEDFSCPSRSWIAGTTELCGGVLTHRDYVYDDFGAEMDTTAASTGTLSVPAGDVRYPDGGPHGTADLVDLSLRIVGDELEVLAEVNALYDTSSTVVALAIDTDDDQSTGGGEWPGFGIASAGWEVLEEFADADPLVNLIGGSIPLPPGDRWRLQAVVAQADGSTADPPAEGRAVMNVAFRGPDELSRFTFLQTSPPEDGAWFEDLQASALETGDISAFGLSVDVSSISSGTGIIEEVGPGLHERVYTSDVTLPPGEGMDYAGIDGRGTGGPSGAFGQVFHYYGRYQPYGLYLPDQPAPHGLVMTYHGSNQNHSQLVNLPGMQQQMGEDNNRILASPLARGVHGYGSDISERDLQDVLADVTANYDIDQTDVHASGYSQGGYVTFRQAALHPDTYAGFTSWVGFTGDDTNPVPADIVTAGAVGNMYDFVGNYRHVPGAMIYGGADELIPVQSSEAMAQQFRDRDFPYIFYMHPSGDHFQFALLDEWGKEAAYSADKRLVTAPPRVVFRTAEVLGDVHVGARHDSAYWVNQIRGRETTDDPFNAEDAYIDVDLTVPGCGSTEPEVQVAPGAGPQPIPWVSDEHVVDGERTYEQDAAITGTLSNVRSLVIDTDATCLDPSVVTFDITSDGPALLRLTSGLQIPLFQGPNRGGIGASGSGDGDVLTESMTIDGQDRIGTAIAITADAFRSATTVVLATTRDYADGLAAGPLAALNDAPILLTDAEGLDPRVATELARLGARDVILVGREQALSEDVATALADLGLATTRIGGEDRFQTAALIADAVVASGGDGSVVYLVRAGSPDPEAGWPDAIAVSGLAGRQGHPILLAGAKDLPAPTMQALARMGTTLVTAIGGTAVIPDRVLAMAQDPDGDGAQIGAQPGGVALHRIAGPTRLVTSALVADRTLDALATTENVWAVSGSDWAPGLAGGPAAAHAGGVLVIDFFTQPDVTGEDSWIARNSPVERLVIVREPTGTDG